MKDEPDVELGLVRELRVPKHFRDAPRGFDHGSDLVLGQTLGAHLARRQEFLFGQGQFGHRLLRPPGDQLRAHTRFERSAVAPQLGITFGDLGAGLIRD